MVWLPRALIVACIAIAAALGITSSVSARFPQEAEGQSPTKVSDVAPNAGSAKAASPGDYSKEPFVVEQSSVKVAFQNDGTYTEDATLRAHVLSQAGLQDFGVLRFPYASTTASLDIVYVRVIKPDNSAVQTAPESAMEMTPDITQQAPQYSDLKEKQIAVKGFEVGDRIEYEYHVVSKTPLIPGQFWFLYNFAEQGINLDEELQISVPANRYVQVKSPDVQPATTVQGAVRVYDWKTARLKNEPADKDADAGDKTPIPSVQLTTFHSWDEVGEWFRGLASPQAAVTPEIRAKADELVKGAKTESDKVQAIYAYVSNNFRYISVSFGIGRYRPHAAAEVLDSGYGDCKDKHTLFAALLSAEGIKAYPALIDSSAKLDADVPSPESFDHVITAVPQGSAYVFLDTTPEVAPFGYLIPQLRDVQTLLIPESGTAELVKTAADPPFKSLLTFQADGTLDDMGTLSSKMQMILRGDDELPYRQIFRRAGQAKWNDLMQSVSSNFGFSGMVSDVTATPAEATDSPFQIEYSYSRKEYSDWANRRISPPFPPVFLPEAPEDTAGKKAKPVHLGSPTDMTYQATIRLPKDSNPSVPAKVDLQTSFAEYHAEYSFTNGSMHFQRRLVTKVHEVPVDELEGYRKFYKAVLDDANTFVELSGNTSELHAPTGSPEAEALIQQGQNAAQRRDMHAAMDAFQRAVDKDPKLAAAWFFLGSGHVVTGEFARGVAEVQQAIALDPNQPLLYKSIAGLLTSMHRDADALDLWKSLEAARPQDADPPRQIAEILMEQKKYSEAAAELEPAIERQPTDSGLELRLGEVTMHLGDKEQAAGMIIKATTMDNSAATLGEAAYALADNDLHLEEASHYADEALKQAESDTSKISIDDPKVEGVRLMPGLASSWDTMGWVQFHLSHFDVAEKYLVAAWKLNQDSTIADHLAKVYAKLGRASDADQFSSFATDIRKTNAKASPEKAGRESENVEKLMAFRTAKMPGQSKGAASSEFLLLFTSGSANPLVKAIGNSDSAIQGRADNLANAKFDVDFPDDAPTRIIRRGIYSCDELTRDCEFVMYPVDSVNSVN